MNWTKWRYNVNDIWNKLYMNCENEMKMKKWSSQWTQFMQLRKEAWKKNSGLQRGLNPWPRDTGAMLYQLSYEATDVGSRSIVGSYVPVKEMSVVFFFQASLRNCINCVHCDDHFFIFSVNYITYQLPRSTMPIGTVYMDHVITGQLPWSTSNCDVTSVWNYQVLPHCLPTRTDDSLGACTLWTEQNVSLQLN